MSIVFGIGIFLMVTNYVCALGNAFYFLTSKEHDYTRLFLAGLNLMAGILLTGDLLF